MSKVYKHVRTPVGKIVKYMFIAFNLIMLTWLCLYWSDIGSIVGKGDVYEQAGSAIGSFLGTGMVLVIWVLGDIILGIPLLLTKGHIVETSLEDIKEQKEVAAKKQEWTKPYIYGGLALLAIIMITTSFIG